MSDPPASDLKAAKREVIEREIAEGFVRCCDCCPFTWAELLAMVTALDRIADEWPALDVGPLGLAYVEQKRDIARHALEGLPNV